MTDRLDSHKGVTRGSIVCFLNVVFCSYCTIHYIQYWRRAANYSLSAVQFSGWALKPVAGPAPVPTSAAGGRGRSSCCFSYSFYFFCFGLAFCVLGALQTGCASGPSPFRRRSHPHPGWRRAWTRRLARSLPPLKPTRSDFCYSV